MCESAAVETLLVLEIIWCSRAAGIRCLQALEASKQGEGRRAYVPENNVGGLREVETGTVGDRVCEENGLFLGALECLECRTPRALLAFKNTEVELELDGNVFEKGEDVLVF